MAEGKEKEHNLRISEGEAGTAHRLVRAIPEFEQPVGRALFDQRLQRPDCLVLVGYVDDVPAGFKIGYARDDGYYSWLGGVLPAFRRQGMAKSLLDHMEKRARTASYMKLWMKTRNRFTGMLHFALRNGFLITDVSRVGKVPEYRIRLEKKL